MNPSSKTVFISGNFNILHPGHLRLFRFAKELGSKLIIAVNSDRLAGKAALVPEQLRLEALQCNNWVTEVFIIDEPVPLIINRLQPDFVLKGKEHENEYNAEDEIVQKYGGKLVFSSGEVIFSSSDLIQKEINLGTKAIFNLPEEYLKRHDLDFEMLRKGINSFKDLNVIVLGDLIIDEYITCDSLGMSQEDPTIVVKPVETKSFIGGAGIVAAHAAGLGAKVKFVSVSGSDNMRDFALAKLSEFNVQTILYEDSGRPTTLKQRFRSKGKTLLRVSHLHQSDISIEMQNKFVADVQSMLNECDLLIFSDFNYGCLPTKMINRIIKDAIDNNIYMVADSQSSSQIGDISRFNHMSLLTPTEREARLSVRDNDNGLVVLAEKLRKKSNAGNILLKIGEEGVLIHAESNKDNWLTDRIPALNSTPLDVAGAGDSMLVVSAMALAAGSSIWVAAILGSIAAAVQVGRIGNIPLKTEELLDIL